VGGGQSHNWECDWPFYFCWCLQAQI